jgi:hypothetical protein
MEGPGNHWKGALLSEQDMRASLKWKWDPLICMFHNSTPIRKYGRNDFITQDDYPQLSPKNLVETPLNTRKKVYHPVNAFQFQIGS